MQHRVAFYPCCGLEIERPLELLRPYADEVIFCDINKSLQPRWQRYVNTIALAGPRPVFLIGDAREIISQTTQMSVLFYRKDSDGEGGSGVLVLGNSFLPQVLRRLPVEGGLIITDGSNSRGGNFKRMIGPNGMHKHGWFLRRSSEQPYLESDGLMSFTDRTCGSSQGIIPTPAAQCWFSNTGSLRLWRDHASRARCARGWRASARR